MPNTATKPSPVAHTLPLKGLSDEQFLDILMVNFPSTEQLRDSIRKLETFIVGYAAEERKRYENLNFTESELDEFEVADSVIDPMTIRMYLGELHREQIGWYKMTEAQREKYCLSLFPGRFCAHYAENMTDPNAKPWPQDEEIIQKPKGYFYSIGKKGIRRLKKKMSQKEIESTPGMTDDPYLFYVIDLFGSE